MRARSRGVNTSLLRRLKPAQINATPANHNNPRIFCLYVLRISITKPVIIVITIQPYIR